MYAVYVLYSPLHKRIYVGYTSDLVDRFLSHNNYGRGYTRRWRPWIIVLVERFPEKRDALQREKSLKSGQGLQYIYEYLNNVGLTGSRVRRNNCEGGSPVPATAP
jgi:putative endonuclease